MDELRNRYGKGSISFGRTLKGDLDGEEKPEEDNK